MEISFIHVNYLLLMLLFPVFLSLENKKVKRPSIVIPSATLIKKISRNRIKPQKDLALLLRCIAIFLLIIAASEPMIITEKEIIRIMPFSVILSFIFFMAEIIFKNAITKRMPIL